MSELTTAEKVQEAIKFIVAEQLQAGELKVWDTVHKKLIPYYGFINNHHIVGITDSIVSAYDTDYFNAHHVYPVPPSAVKVGQIWDCGEIVLVRADVVCYWNGHSVVNYEGGIQKFVSNNKLISEPKPKSLAELGLKVGARLQSITSGQTYLVDNITLRDEYSPRDMQQHTAFDHLFLLPEAGE